MKNIFATTGLILLGLFALVAVAHADGTTNCQPIYGGGQSCVSTGNIVINKTVQNPQTNGFVDNLGVNDPHFTAGQTVSFQLTVKNTGGSTISQVFVKDVFPQFLSFVAGQGNFDTNANTLSFEVDNLQANESRTFTVQGKVASADQLGQNVTCVINQSVATTSNNNGSSQDNAQFCIEKNATPTTTTVTQPTMTKGGLPIFPSPKVTTTPPTGPETLPLLGMIPTGIAGFILRRKSK